ncbi:MAG TPA: zinc ribbon domain-containing protein [Pyrinomonadaceae bacterium]|nr:zinc ribbon domain-containing protein [Pyrinomonadaceae bacterium]
MFCPKCGRDDAQPHKFCPTCGTNLDVVTLALTTSDDSLTTRANKHLDRSVARYADHFFDNAPIKAREGGIGNSWRLVGQGVLTFLLDIMLLPLMFFFLPFRVLLLALYTPLGLLQERSERKRKRVLSVEGTRESSKRGLLEPGGWRVDSVGSVTENTTVHLAPAESTGERINTSESLPGKPRITSR